MAIGTDLDANYKPVLTDHQQFHDVSSDLAERGFTPVEIDAILGANALRLFEQVWPTD